MKKRLILSIFFTVICFGVIFSVYATQNWEIFNRESIFFADENVIIKDSLPHHLEMVRLGDQTVDTDEFLPADVKKFTVEVNGINLTFAKNAHGIYNVPLEDSPLLYHVNGQSFTLVNDHLYKIDRVSEKAIQMTTDHYLGKSKSELDQQGLHWISDLQVDMENDTLYYVSNRRAMAEEGKANEVDLWKIDINTGIEELVVKNGRNFLGEVNQYIIASIINNNSFEIQMITEQESKTLVSDVEMVLGRDKYHFFYSKGSFVYKYDIYNDRIEELSDKNTFLFSGVTSSPDLEKSFLIATNMKNGHEVLYVTDRDGTYQTDVPEKFIIMNISWISNEEVLFSGYLNNDERNVITYKINFDK